MKSFSKITQNTNYLHIDSTHGQVEDNWQIMRALRIEQWAENYREKKQQKGVQTLELERLEG